MAKTLIAGSPSTWIPGISPIPAWILRVVSITSSVIAREPSQPRKYKRDHAQDTGRGPGKARGAHEGRQEAADTGVDVAEEPALLSQGRQVGDRVDDAMGI